MVVWDQNSLIIPTPYSVLPKLYAVQGQALFSSRTYYLCTSVAY